MGAQSLLLTIYLALLVCHSTAIPQAIVEPRDTREPSILQAPKLQVRFPGFYFKEAAENCNGNQFDTLVKTVEEVIPYMEKNKDDLYNTPGWNRFFVQNEYVRTIERMGLGSRVVDGKNWENSARYPYYKMIINNFNQVINFPTQGKKNWKEGIQKDRITLTCKHVNINAKDSCANQGTWATTYRPRVTGRGEVVVFCPNFFDDARTKHLSQINHGHAWQIGTLSSREHVLAHEMFHAQSAVGTEEHITDLNAELPGEGTFTKDVYVYGATRCAKFAWLYLDHGIKKRQVNIQVQRNADNYAWLFTFNWFNDKLKWGSNGQYIWARDEFRRSLLGPRSGTNMTSWENTNWEGTATFDSDDTTDEDEVWPLPNCHQVGGDPMNVDCEYMNEPYKQWMTDHGYSASPSRLPSSTPLTSSTPLIPSISLIPTPTSSAAPSCTDSNDCSGWLCGSGLEAACWDSFCKCGPTTTASPTASPTDSTALSCTDSNDCSGWLCGSGLEAACWDSFCKCGPTTTASPTASPTDSTALSCTDSNDCSGWLCGSGLEAACWDSFCKCGPTTTASPTDSTALSCTDSSDCSGWLCGSMLEAACWDSFCKCGPTT